MGAYEASVFSDAPLLSRSSSALQRQGTVHDVFPLLQEPAWNLSDPGFILHIYRRPAPGFFCFGYRNVSHQRCRRILRRISADAVLQASVVCDADLCAYGGFVFLLHAVYL